MIFALQNLHLPLIGTITKRSMGYPQLMSVSCAKKYSIQLKPLNEDHKKRGSEMNELNIELSTSKKWIMDNSQVNYSVFFFIRPQKQG